MRDRPGRDVSRIEGFSDAVFGFALTLLVASIEVPPDFDALKQTLRGFLPFALTFALVCWIWYLHYSFFREYGLEGPFQGFNGWIRGSRRDRMFPSSTPEHP